MNKRGWLGGLAVGVLVAVLALPGAADAGAIRWVPWDGALDPSVGVAGNLNSTVVVGVGQVNGRVYHRDGATGGWVDHGRPTTSGGTPAVVKRVATSAGQLYAVADGGEAFWFDAAANRWQLIADDTVDLLASRDGTTVTPVNQPPRFEPYLYRVTGKGHVVRRDGQGWTLIGTGAGQDSLAERGPRGSTRLFMLTAAHDEIRRWDGVGAIWTRIGGAAETIAANLVTLAMTGTTGKIRLYDEPSGTWPPLVMAAGSTVPFRSGGRLFLGERTMYYRAADRNELWAVRFAEVRPPGAVIVTPWWLLSRAPVSDVATHSSIGDDADAVAVTSGGVPSQLAWGVLRPAMVGRPTGEQGHAIDFTTAAYDLWTGALYTAGVTGGSLPPGLDATVNDAGQLRVTGVPTAAGTFVFTLTVLDSSGAAGTLTVEMTVVPPGGSGFHIITWANPASSTSVANCLASGQAMPVWFRDRTAGGGWTELGTPLPSGLVTDPGGATRCAPTAASSRTVPLPMDHVVEAAALDPGAPHCAGGNDPQIVGCPALHVFVTGSAFHGARDFEVH